MIRHDLHELAAGGHFFECPRWHEGRWWVSDFYAHAVLAFAPDGRREHVLEVPAQPGGLGWLPGGDLLVVSAKDHRLLRRSPDGAVAVHAELSRFAGGQLNDMLVRDGHAWVGNFGFDLMGGADPAPAALVHVAPDGRADVAADGLWFPNGMVVVGDRLIVAETFGARLTSFAIGPDHGLGDRQVWAQVQPAPEPSDLPTMLGAFSFAPDGCAADAEGHVWAANALGPALCRVAPGGAIVDEVPLPDGLAAYACGLGGDDGRTLVVCAAPDFHEAARIAATEAVLLTTTVDVPAAPVGGGRT